MLILTRREGESVKIGDGITITVLDVKGNQVHREEIHARIRREGLASGSAEPK